MVRTRTDGVRGQAAGAWSGRNPTRKQGSRADGRTNPASYPVTHFAIITVA